MENWLNPTLSLSTQFQQEHDRRAAVRLTHQELQIVADRLIVDWYRHQHVAEQLLRRVSFLEMQLMLASAPPAKRGPDERHLEWAKELLAPG